MGEIYVHHRLLAAPRRWAAVADELNSEPRRQRLSQAGGALYGIWRSQIGRPRDELNAITVWPEGMGAPLEAAGGWCGGQGCVDGVVEAAQRVMRPTLRPLDATPPIRQGNYAFRYFETPSDHWGEFLKLCADAWPGFENAYDSQVIGLWAYETETRPGCRASLLLTRRPNLAMWERSKLPENEREAAV